MHRCLIKKIVIRFFFCLSKWQNIFSKLKSQIKKKQIKLNEISIYTFFSTIADGIAYFELQM